MKLAPSQPRSRRLEVRTTDDERELIDRAVYALGTDVSSFVVREVVSAAREVLASRSEFALSEEARAEWDRVNRRSARDLPGLRRLMQRPSPFYAWCMASVALADMQSPTDVLHLLLLMQDARRTLLGK
ncbi:MAG: DUF1778 domain-containing protein [Polyangiales bacterium]